MIKFSQTLHKSVHFTCKWTTAPGYYIDNCAGRIWRRHTFLVSYSQYLRVSYSLDMRQYLHLVNGWLSIEACSLTICLSEFTFPVTYVLYAYSSYLDFAGTQIGTLSCCTSVLH